MVFQFKIRTTNRGHIVKAFGRVVQILQNKSGETARGILMEALHYAEQIIMDNTHSRSVNTGNGIAQNLIVRTVGKSKKGDVEYQLGIKKAFLLANPGEALALEFGYTPHWVTAVTNNPKGMFPQERKQSLLDWHKIVGHDLRIWSRKPVFVNAAWSSSGLRVFERTYIELLGISKRQVSKYTKQIELAWRS